MDARTISVPTSKEDFVHVTAASLCACVKSCPAGVDIPGYIALVHDKRYADAVRLNQKG